MTGGQALVAQLIIEGVEDIFGIPGVQLDWAVDAMRQRANELRLIVPRHEQATSYMADGYARTTGREGVCMVVPGPGMLNALSGIATAYACSAPVLFLVGQIPSGAIGKAHGLLHELPDQSGILKSLTKWHGLARTPADIPGLVHEAFVHLRSGTPQPVALELPPDVLQAKGMVTLLPRAQKSRPLPDQTALDQAVSKLAAARSPVIWAGGGAMASDAGAAIQALAERLQAPVVMTEGGRGLLDSRHPLALPGIGGRALLPHADMVLVLGSRFVDAEGKPTDARDGVEYIYVNTRADHMAGGRKAGLTLGGDVQGTVAALLEALPTVQRASAETRVAKVRTWVAAQVDPVEPQQSYVKALRAAMADDDILVSELTQVGYYANVAFPAHAPRRYVTPGYQGTLGYGFNTALGAAHGNPDNRVVSLNGDGGFGWGMQELATLARDKLNLSVIVFVDGKFGNVRRIQKRTFGVEFATDVSSPDFELLGRAYGIPTVLTDSPDGLREALDAAKARTGPALIVVKVGEMPSPWALIHAFVPSATPVPANPLDALADIEA
jgi:acetolactate synthase-1/2/3 large subunit